MTPATAKARPEAGRIQQGNEMKQRGALPFDMVLAIAGVLTLGLIGLGAISSTAAEFLGQFPVVFLIAPAVVLFLAASHSAHSITK